MFNSVQGGYIGNVAGNPFGSDFVVPQQRRSVPGGPQMAPLKQPPARVFPPDQPGREGAIDVRSAMGVSGMNIGNEAVMAGPLTLNPYNSYVQSLSGNNEGQELQRRPEPIFSSGGGSSLPGRLNPYNSYVQSLTGNNEGQELQTRPEPVFSGPNRFNPLSRYMQSISTAKEAGFDRKTVS